MAASSSSTLDSRPVIVASTLLSFTLIVAILFFAKAVVLPLALAIMLAFILNPVVMLLHRWGFSRIPAVLTTVVVTGALVGGLIWLVTLQFNSLITDLPKYEDNVRGKIASLRTASEGSTLNKLRTKLREMVVEGGEKTAAAPPAAPPAAAETAPRGGSGDEGPFAAILGPVEALSPAIEGLAKFLLSLVLAIFILIRREDLRNRLLSFATGGSLTMTTKALDDAGQRISRYMIMQLLINGSFGFAVGVGLFFIGVPYPLLWGLCAGIFRYIPYVGAWIAAAPPLAVSFVTSAHWTGMLLILGLFLLLELITANVLEPCFYGQGTGVSEVALLVCAAFWAWLWGPIGLMLATPLTVCVVVAGKYVPSLSFFDKLLGDRPVLKPFAVYLQRLLARDLAEAASVVKEYCVRHAPETVYDNLFIPALSLARADRAKGAMLADDAERVIRETAALLESISGNSGLQSPDLAVREGPPVFALPAHDKSEELTLVMLEQLIQPAGLRLETCSTRMLPSESIELVVQEKPSIVLVAALAPEGLPQALYLCERLRAGLPQVGIIVGYWGYGENLDEVIATLRAAGASYVTTTLLGARSHIVSMLEMSPPPVLAAESRTRKDAAPVL